MDSTSYLLHVLTVLALAGLWSIANQNNSDVKKLNDHTHAADGSVQGIGGWY